MNKIRCHKFKTEEDTIVTLIEIGNPDSYLDVYNYLTINGFKRVLEIRYLETITKLNGFYLVLGWVTPYEFLQSLGYSCYILDGVIHKNN